jgi:hypothetical protein
MWRLPILPEGGKFLHFMVCLRGNIVPDIKKHGIELACDTAFIRKKSLSLKDGYFALRKRRSDHIDDFRFFFNYYDFRNMVIAA